MYSCNVLVSNKGLAVGSLGSWSRSCELGLGRAACVRSAPRTFGLAPCCGVAGLSNSPASRGPSSPPPPAPGDSSPPQTPGGRTVPGSVCVRVRVCACLSVCVERDFCILKSIDKVGKEKCSEYFVPEPCFGYTIGATWKGVLRPPSPRNRR